MIQQKVAFTADEANYEGERIEAINNHLETLISNKVILSANYCLARDGKIFANNAVGKLSYNEEDDRQLQPDTIQRIASITKLFTAVAIWKLAEDGKLRVNQSVGDFIEEFKGKPFEEITIAHLLSHTSGLQADPGCYENQHFLSPWECIDLDKGANWIKAALRSGMRTKPGEEWAYSTFGFVILGEIISRVSGQFANDYIIEQIAKPCGMKDTGFNYRNKEVLKRTNIPSENREKLIQDVLNDVKREEEYAFWDKIPGTGGAMYSTAYDLCRFGIMLQQGGTLDGIRVIGRKTIEKMTASYIEPHIIDYCWNAGGIYRRYGMGPDLRWKNYDLHSEGTYFHEGAGACCLTIDPVEKMVAAWFVPFVDDKWCSEPLYNTGAVIWSGLK